MKSFDGGDNDFDDDSSFDSNEGFHNNHFGGDQSSLGVSSTGQTTSSSGDERDEVKEIEKMSKLETFRVNLGRYAVILILLITTVAVTMTTYYFLNLKEYGNFEIAVSSIYIYKTQLTKNSKTCFANIWCFNDKPLDPNAFVTYCHPELVSLLFFLSIYLSTNKKYEQFARTVADAALEQQRDVRDSLKALSNAVS